jgi:uncharacterized protein YuzB (UPF0349 family)
LSKNRRNSGGDTVLKSFLRDKGSEVLDYGCVWCG